MTRIPHGILLSRRYRRDIPSNMQRRALGRLIYTKAPLTLGVLFRGEPGVSLDLAVQADADFTITGPLHVFVSISYFSAALGAVTFL